MDRNGERVIGYRLYTNIYDTFQFIQHKAYGCLGGNCTGFIFLIKHSRFGKLIHIDFDMKVSRKHRKEACGLRVW